MQYTPARHMPKTASSGNGGISAGSLSGLKDGRYFPGERIYGSLMGRVPHYAKLLRLELRQIGGNENAAAMLRILDGKLDMASAQTLLLLSDFIVADGKGPCQRAKTLAGALSFLFMMAERAREGNVGAFEKCRSELEAQRTPVAGVFKKDWTVLFAL